MTDWQSQPATHWNNTKAKKLMGILLLSAFCSILLGGCDNFFDKVGDLLRINGTAEAQGDRDRDRVQVHSVTLSAFFVQVDDENNNSPTVAVNGDFIEITMNSTGDVFGSSTFTQELRDGDRIILHKSTNTMTVVFASPVTQ